MDETLAACIREMNLGPSDEELERILKAPGFDWYALDMPRRDVIRWQQWYNRKWDDEKRSVDAYNENNWESFNKLKSTLLTRLEAAEKEVRILGEQVTYLRNKQFEKRGDWL